MFEWLKRFLWKINRASTTESAVKMAFQKVPATSMEMRQNIDLWYAMYVNRPPWETCDVQSLGIPAAIARELSRTAMTEFSVLVSGSPRADYINDQLQKAVPAMLKALELGLALGGVALKPVAVGDKLSVDYTGATAFVPTRLAGDGSVTAGVFREVQRYDNKIYVRMEDHEFIEDESGTLYRIRNKAFHGSSNGQPIGDEIPLDTVPDWAGIQPEVLIQGLDRPLYGVFQVPRENNVEFESPIGVSIYSGAAVNLIKQADEQWGRLIWEYESGERKIFVDGNTADAGMYSSRLFEYGSFGGITGDFFKEFNPAMRDDPLYQGFQRIVQRIEFETGMAYGDISDPQSVEKTATEIRASKQRKYITIQAIQTEFEKAITDLIYAMNAFCDIYQIVPDGVYDVAFTWGDSVMDDPDAQRQDKAIDLQEVSAGLRNPYEYRMKWYGESEEEAKANLPGMETLVDESQFEIGTLGGAPQPR